MSATAAIVIEGVLKSTTGDSVIPSGLHLYHGLAQVMKIALVHDGDEAQIARWLAINGFKDHVHLLTPEPDDVVGPAKRRVRQMIRLRELGCDVEFLVETNPKVAAKVFRSGSATMMMSHPKYSLPEFRPGSKSVAVPWSQLVREIKVQENLRASDVRIGSTDE